MKIIIPLLGTFGKSGGFRVLSQLANLWINDNHEVVFLSYINAEDPYFPTDAKILYYDNSGNIKTQKNKQYPKALLGMFSLREALRKALNKLEADIVLANHSFTALPVKKSTIKAKKFYYVQAYEPEYYYHNTIKDKIYKAISKKSYKLGLNIIVNAPMYMDYKEIKTDKFVFPGLDLNIFTPKQKNKDTDKFILGTIGRLEEYKGTKYVLDAFSLLRKELGEKIELHIAFGEDSFKLIEGVTVIFPNGDKELAEYYNSLNAYISAGLVQLNAVHYPVIESMACKTPVITTGYLPANLENAWIVPIKDAVEIKNKVLEILDSNSSIKTENAYREIQQFDWKNVSGKMLSYFRL